MKVWVKDAVDRVMRDMAAKLRAEAARLSPPTRQYRQLFDRGPIRVQAMVGDPIREIEEGEVDGELIPR